MRLFEIKTGTCVDLDKVEAISELSPTTSAVFINGKGYESTISYYSMKTLVKAGEMLEQEQINSPMAEVEPVQVMPNKFDSHPAW
jgi:hypothetical protein